MRQRHGRAHACPSLLLTTNTQHRRPSRRDTFGQAPESPQHIRTQAPESPRHIRTAPRLSTAFAREPSNPRYSPSAEPRRQFRRVRCYPSDCNGVQGFPGAQGDSKFVGPTAPQPGGRPGHSARHRPPSPLCLQGGTPKRQRNIFYVKETSSTEGFQLAHIRGQDVQQE